jgi:hypothetical protein
MLLSGDPAIAIQYNTIQYNTIQYILVIETCPGTSQHVDSPLMGRRIAEKARPE